MLVAIAAVLFALTGSCCAVAAARSVGARRCPGACRCDPALLQATCTAGRDGSLPLADLPSSLQHLDLSSNDLSNIHTLTLPNLLVLNVSHNRLTDWRSVQNVSAPQLTTLDASFNHLVVPPDQNSLSFPRLQHLNLHHNQLNYVLLSPLSDGKTLRTVDLRFNVIKTVLVDVLNLNLSHIQSLDLSRNALSELGCVEWRSLLDVQLLNLSHNQLGHIPSASPRCNVTTVTRRHNQTLDTGAAVFGSDGNDTIPVLLHSQEETQAADRSVETLDLSHNALSTVHATAFQHLRRLKDLRLNANLLPALEPACFQDLRSLEVLDLNANPIVHIPKRAFASCSKMQYLTVSHMPNLTHIHFQAFAGLKSLRQLVISNNGLLQYLHASTLSPLQTLRVLDIQSCAIDTIFPDLLSNTSTLEVVYMSGNPLNCGCDFKWIYEWITKFNNSMPKFHAPENVTCASPSLVSDKAVSDLYGYNFSCSPAAIVNVTSYEAALFKVGSSALIDCVVTGEPRPQTTWVTPRGHMVLHHPAYVDWLRPGPHHHTFHANHPWHESGARYASSVPRSSRIHVLSNGSLFVDYMLRNDAGAYTCMALNPHGNQTVTIQVRLDYGMLKWNVIVSVAVGYACALAFFSIAVLTAVLRYIAYFCSIEQREKRKSISEILASLDQYRHDTFDRLSQYKSEKIDRLSQYKTEKFDKISAYKTEKFDKLSAFKSAKFDQLAQYKIAKLDKLRSYKSLSFSNLVLYIKNMREYYIGQMVRIKENCAQQSEKLRETYTMRTSAFKDYRSHKLDALRENYAQQVMKIKEYGSSQMAKLREQYRTQQTHILKLIELMGIGNCMHIVEAECMRTESMLFDAEELNFDFDAHPVHVPAYFFEEDNESVYETAGSHLDISPAPKKPRKLQSTNQDQRPDLLSTNAQAAHPPHKRTHNRPHRHHRKHKRCRHKRPTNLPSFDDPDEADVKQNKRKRRRLKEKRTTALRRDDDADTTAPDTPPEQRSPMAHATTRRYPDPTVSSEYDTASARMSREVTPDTRLTTTATVDDLTPADYSTPVTGQADVGSAHNVIDFSHAQHGPGIVTPTAAAAETWDPSPVHKPSCTSSSLSTPSTPTVTDQHVIVIDPESTPTEDDRRNAGPDTVESIV